MSDLVRAKDPSTGHEFTTTALAAKMLGADVVDKPAVDERGNALPAKPRVRVRKDTAPAASQDEAPKTPARKTPTRAARRTDSPKEG